MKKNDLLFYVALVFAIWFALTAWIWVYLVSLLFSYPFGLISLLIWLFLKKENQPRTKWIPRILGVGFIISLGVFVALLIWG